MIATHKTPTVLVVDDFFEDPHDMRAFALRQEFKEHPEYHRGKRTDSVFLYPGLKERFEQLLGRKIVNWGENGVNGCFQSCEATDLIVYHTDIQSYAAVIFLTPDAPVQGGTCILRSKHTKERKCNNETLPLVFRRGFYDSTEFEVLDNIGNQFNRLVIWDARCIHAASTYFGNNLETSRLFQIFFFDVEENS